MIKGSLFQRLTFTYDTGWSHLDKERYLGQLKVTPPRIVQRGDMWGDGKVVIQHARVRSGLKGRVAASAIANTLSGSYCRHEHDCCGCTFKTVTVEQRAPRKFVVRTVFRINR